MNQIDDLPKLILCPLLDSYRTQWANDVIITQYKAGPPRIRKDSVGAPHTVQVAFRHKAIHQEYILDFYELYKTQPFAMRMKIKGTTMQWFECYFLSASEEFLGGNAYGFSATLAVMPRPFDEEVAKDFVDAYIRTGGDLADYFDPLERLINIELPHAMRSLKDAKS